MAAEQPRIVQGDHQGHVVAQPGDVPQIEIPSVKVMRVDNLRTIRWTLQQVRRPGEVEVLDPATQVEPALQLADGCQPTGTSGDAWVPRTVQGHLARIFDKLQATSRTEAVMRAVSLGWLSPGDTLE